MSDVPTPEQLAAMAREYNAVRPITLPAPEPDNMADLALATAKLSVCTKRLLDAPGHNGALLARQADDTVARICAQIEALDGGGHGLPDIPLAKSHTQALRDALLAAADVSKQLYVERDNACLAGQLPFLTSLAHYAYSLLLTMTVF